MYFAEYNSKTSATVISTEAVKPNESLQKFLIPTQKTALLNFSYVFAQTKCPFP